MGTISGRGVPLQIPIGAGAMAKFLAKNGQMPPVTMKIKSLEFGTEYFFNRFLNYQFMSSILTPVDQWNLTLLMPDDPNIFGLPVKEGDEISLFGNNIQLATGLVDQTEYDVDADYGEKLAINGRDLLGQWEDQDAVSLDSKIVVAKKATVPQIVQSLARDTRVNPTPQLRDCPRTEQAFATQPGESKLASLQRHVESLNVLFWMSPQGTLIVGKPNFAQKAKQRLFVSKKDRASNVIGMKVTRASGTIPNIIIPIFNGQESVQDRLQAEQVFYNPAYGPNRLRKLKHRLPKSVVISAPSGGSPEEIQSVTFLNAAINDGPKPGYGNLLRAYARRELARRNKDELVVQIQMFGHYNDLGEPFLTDTIYNIYNDRAQVDEDMYLFEVQYEGGEDKSQTTNLWFCKKNTLVSDTRIK
jgi:prophage tail gpP-like protein